MKKGLLVMMVLLCMMLIGCGKTGNDETTDEINQVLDKTDKNNYIGMWKDKDGFCVRIDKGGAGCYTYDGDTWFCNFTWQIQDDVIVLDLDWPDIAFRAVLELNEDGTSLEQVGGEFPSHKAGIVTQIFYIMNK